jgi:hypothetical protein
VVNDPNVQTDGFINLEGGMNSSWPLNTLPQSTCGLGLNVTFRGGKVMTRPGFRQANLINGQNDGFSSLEEYFQGAFFYFNPASSTHDRLIVIAGGNFLVIPLDSFSVNRLYPALENGFGDTTFKNNQIAEHYFCQVEKYLVVQNGIDKPLIYDGNNLFVVGQGPIGSVGVLTDIPIGRQMSYNHDRLFIALQNGYEVVASDLNYGGSSQKVNIVKSERVSSIGVRFTTASNHNLVDGDEVYIRDHSPDIDLNTGNDTVKIKVESGSPTTFVVLKDVSSDGENGYGGYAIKKNSSRDYDALLFSENGILSEGGTYRIAASLGKITGMSFQSIGDTQSGQGDLLVFCQKGAVSFKVSERDRTRWSKTIDFQKILFPDIGCVSDRSLVNVNSDIFWRSFDGIRCYSNARKDTNNSFGYVPVSNEIRTILEKDSSFYLHRTSSAFFDNRLLVTVSPRQDLRGLADVKNDTKQLKPITFQGVAVYDFASILQSGGSKTAVWEGLWFCGDILQILSTGYGPKARCFIFRADLQEDQAKNTISLWELSQFDRYDTTSSGGASNIISVIETKSFPFRSEFELKKLSKADLWLHEIEGRATIKTYYRPDQYPCWVEWHNFLECADNKSCINSKIEVNVVPKASAVAPETRSVQILSVPTSDVFYFRLGYGPQNTNSSYNKVTSVLQFGSPVTTSGGQLGLKNALETIGFDFSGGGGVIRTDDSATTGGNPSTFIYTIYTTGDYPPLVIYPTNSSTGDEGGLVAALTPVDLQPQFRTQIRLPSPLDPPDEKACDPITNRPFRNGHEFQFRIKWDGFVRINKFLAYAYPLIEQIGSDCP